MYFKDKIKGKWWNRLVQVISIIVPLIVIILFSRMVCDYGNPTPFDIFTQANCSPFGAARFNRFLLSLVYGLLYYVAIRVIYYIILYIAYGSNKNTQT
ncbi:hypothetical protein COB64_00110 [Candidatus Wolfebacteria bacterium]|nr:MAG: hypothetical protein COB64_00110 [Candidatus Wolfebacteria bacterium]